MALTHTPPTYLAKKNAHPRDEFIEFDEGPHIYTIHGQQGFTSVTTWNHSHFSHFDADAIIDKILTNRKYNTDPHYKYYLKTREEIKEMWDKNRDSAATSGTNMHYDVECYYNGINNGNTSQEFEYFLKFAKDYDYLIPYRTEWMIYHEELKLAGSIDMVFYNKKDDNYWIYDWKRCKEIVNEHPFGQHAANPVISHFPDTNFWHYTLQLNTYKAILEEKYGMKIAGLALVVLHPDNYYKSYDRIECPFIQEDIQALFEQRRQLLQNA